MKESCFYCGKKGSTRDHVIPRCRGGTKTVPACGKCNQLKASLTVNEFRAVMAVRMGLLPDIKNLYQFPGERIPQVCVHDKLITEQCFKCGRWLGHPCLKVPAFKPKNANEELLNEEVKGNL